MEVELQKAQHAVTLATSVKQEAVTMLNTVSNFMAVAAQAQRDAQEALKKVRADMIVEIMEYSETCLKRTLLGKKICVRLRQVSNLNSLS